MRANTLISLFSRGLFIDNINRGLILTSILHFSFVNAIPTAELEPITETYVQGDEVCGIYHGTFF